MEKRKIDIVETLVHQADLSREVLDCATNDHEFLKVLHGLEQIHNGKGVLYGNYLETHGQGNELLCLTEHFCDMKRKYIRADHYIKQRFNDNNLPLTELLKSYSDLAVYAMLGLQLVFKKMEESGKRFDGVIYEVEDDIPF